MGLLPLGTVIGGRYRVLRRLGEGGMGSVYQVEDVRPRGRVWAMKELLDDGTLPPDEVAQARARFAGEITLMRRLRHPGLPAFAESFDEAGKRYFVMEYIPGGTLDERLTAAHAALPERDVLRWMIAVCDALSYLHNQRPPIIVRDLKPGNIMVTPGGDVRLIDLGIARTYKPGKLTNTENLGTMTYASPEHLGQTQTDPRSDIYSLGATIYHLVTNVEPVPMETPAPGALRRHAPAVSAATEAAVIRSMALDPARRFQSAAQLKDALARCLALIEPPSPAAAPPRHPAVAPGPRARPAAARPAVARPPAMPAPARAPAPPAAVPRSQASLSSGGDRTPGRDSAFCPACGYANRPGARFCAHDGTPLDPRGARVAASAAAPPTVRGVDPAATAALTAQLAREAFATGRLLVAVRHCERADREGTADYDLYLLLGRASRALGRHSAAADAFAKAARLRATAEAHALEGQSARDAGDPARALVAFTRARQLNPRDPDLCVQLGLTCLDLGQLAQAEGELEAALELRPEDGPALLALGQVCAKRQDWHRAESYLQRAAAALPASTEPVRRLAEVRAASSAHPKRDLVERER
ncbi:MAG: protein kinase [Ktedonobacterales bacterium]